MGNNFILRSDYTPSIKRYFVGSKLPMFSVFPSITGNRTINSIAMSSTAMVMYHYMYFDRPSYVTSVNMYIEGGGAGTKGTLQWRLMPFNPVTRVPSSGSVVCSGSVTPSEYSWQTLGSSLSGYVSTPGFYALEIKNTFSNAPTGYFLLTNYQNTTLSDIGWFLSNDGGATFYKQGNGALPVYFTCSTLTGYASGRMGFPIRFEDYGPTSNTAYAFTLHDNGTKRSVGWAHFPKDDIAPVQMRAVAVGTGTLASRGNLVAEVYQGTPTAPTLVARSVNTARDDRTAATTALNHHEWITFFFSGQDTIRANTWTAWVIRAEGGDVSNGWRIQVNSSLQNQNMYNSYIAGGSYVFNDAAYVVESDVSPISFTSSAITAVPWIECYARCAGVIELVR